VREDEPLDVRSSRKFADTLWRRVPAVQLRGRTGRIEYRAVEDKLLVTAAI